MTKSSPNRYALAAYFLFAIAFVSLAIFGGIQNYSPVPFWDMWRGYLDFFINSDEGFGAWWVQHNEHRILLARVLFWIDLSWFNGTIWFLIITNYLLAATLCVLFYVILRERIGNSYSNFTAHLLSLITIIMLFSWIQWENLIWGFQSSFFLAYILPLSAFYLLHKSNASETNKNTFYFILASMIGIMSLGSMANGVMTLPLMTVMAGILKMHLRRLSILLALSILGIICYFYGYHSIQGHGSLRELLKNNPLGIIEYMLLYIGGPFFFVAGKGDIGKSLAQLSALFVIGSSLAFTWRSIKAQYPSSLEIALLTFLLYIGGTALGTAGGRLNFGVEQALSYRYQTPALLAWVTILTLYAPAISKAMNWRILFSTFFIPILLLPSQLEAVIPRSEALFERLIAALAIELGIQDEAQIASIHNSAEKVINYSKKPIEREMSIFGNPLIRGAHKMIGQKDIFISSTRCQGYLDSVSNIDGDYFRISGWLFNSEAQRPPSIIHILNEEDRIIGYALTGQPRLDVQKVFSQAASSGFKGYVKKDQMGATLIVRGLQPDCDIEMSAPLNASYFKGRAQ